MRTMKDIAECVLSHMQMQIQGSIGEALGGGGGQVAAAGVA